MSATFDLSNDLILGSDGLLPLGQSSTAGRDQKLAARRIAIQDGEYQSEHNSIFTRQPARAVRPYDIEWQDISPLTTADGFAKTSKFRFGHEGGSLVRKVELVYTLPAVSNGTSDDGSGVLGYNIAWQKWIGFVMQQEVVLKSGTAAGSSIRRYSGDMYHAFTRLLSKDNSPQDEAFRRRVGENCDHAAAQRSRIIVVPVWLPWGDALDNCMPVTGLADEFTLEVKHRSIHNCLRREPGAAATASYRTYQAGEPAFVDLKLRVHYVHLEKAERLFQTKTTLQAGGISFMIHDNEDHEDAHSGTLSGIGVPTDAALVQTRETIDVPLRNATNPCVMAIGAVRYKIDLDPLNNGSSSAVVSPVLDEPIPSGAGSAGYADSKFIPQPERMNFIPVAEWELRDAQQRFTPTFDYYNWEQCMLNEYFDCQMFQNLAVIPFTFQPAVSRHGMGHLTLSSLKNPIMRLLVPHRSYVPGRSDEFKEYDPWYRSYGASTAWAGADFSGDTTDKKVLDKRVDVWCIVRNRLHVENSEVLKFYR